MMLPGQISLFEEQQANLRRVGTRIIPRVMKFLTERGPGRYFHASELHDAVGKDVAPASADRILRELRKQGRVEYQVVNRRSSLYRIGALR